MKHLVSLVLSIALFLGIAPVESAFEHAISDLDLLSDFTSFDAVRDSLGNEHYFTAGVTLAHSYRLQGGWAYETIDPVASTVSCTRKNDELWVVYVSGSELRIAWGSESNWQIQTVSMDLGQPVNPDITVSDDGTVWVFASDPTGRLWAWDVTDGSITDEPVLIDAQGKCDRYIDSVGLSGNGFLAIYHVGVPNFDMRQAVFDGVTLSVETIREVGNQGEHCSIVRGTDGSLHLTAWDGYDNNLLYGRLNEFGEWDWETPDPRWGCGRAATVALDVLDHPVIAHVSADYKRLEVTRFDGTGWASEEMMFQMETSNARPIRIIDPDESIFGVLPLQYASGYYAFDLIRASTSTRSIQTEIVCFSPRLIVSSQIHLDSEGAMRLFVFRSDGYTIWNRIGSVWAHRTMRFEMPDSYQELLTRFGHGDPDRFVVAVGLTLPSQYLVWVDTWNGFDVSRQLIESVPDRRLMALDLCLSPDHQDQLQIAQRDDYTMAVSVRNLSRQDETWESQNVDSFSQRTDYDDVLMRARMQTAPYPIIVTFYNELRVSFRNASGWSTTALLHEDEYDDHLEFVLAGDGSPRIRLDEEVYTFTGESWKSEMIGLNPYYTGWDIDPQDRLFVVSGDYDDPCHIIRQDGIGWVDEILGDATAGCYIRDCTYDGHRFVSLLQQFSGTGHYRLFLLTSTPLPPTLELTMNDRTFSSGEPFDLGYRIQNGPDPLHAQLAVLLDIPVGETHLYYTWPGWQDLSHGIPTTAIDLQADQSREETILSFTWPSGAGQMSGLSFWGFLVNEDGTGFAADTAHLYWHFR